MAAATPVSPDHAPTARLRSSRWKLDSMIARLPGVRRAPPTPWRRRATMRSGASGAAAHRTDAAVNTPAP